MDGVLLAGDVDGVVGRAARHTIHRGFDSILGLFGANIAG
jgi:hypothetical protein